jgi:NitT/TauT family transport system substrate-binding protein
MHIPRARLVAAALLLGLTACAAPAAAPAPAPAAVPSGASASPSGAAAAATQVPRIPVRLAYTALVASQSVPWIAQEAGIFDRHGLDVSMTFLNGGPPGVAALVSGEVDALIVGAASVIRSTIQGTDTMLIGATKNLLVGSVMGKPEIRTPADLRGRRIGVASRGSNSELVARVGLLRNGIDPDEGVTYLAVGSGGQRLAAMQQGTIDACGCIPPDNIAAEEAGFHTVIDVSKLGVKYPATTIATTRARAQEQPELYRRFLEAMADGVYRYKNDPDFAQRVITDYTKIEDERALRAGYEIERDIMASDLQVDMEAIRAAMDEIAPTIPQVLNATPDDFVDPRFLRELQASGYFERLGR